MDSLWTCPTIDSVIKMFLMNIYLQVKKPYKLSRNWTRYIVIDN